MKKKKKKRKRKIHKDKRGREFIKESYFVRGKMKFRRIYVIDGIPENEFYENNASDIDRYLDGDYWLISYERDCFESIKPRLATEEEESILNCIYHSEIFRIKESDEYCWLGEEIAASPF